MVKLRIEILLSCFSSNLPAIIHRIFSLLFLAFSVDARYLSMRVTIRIFDQLVFSPKIQIKSLAQSQTSKYDRLAHFPSDLSSSQLLIVIFGFKFEVSMSILSS